VTRQTDTFALSCNDKFQNPDALLLVALAGDTTSHAVQACSYHVVALQVFVDVCYAVPRRTVEAPRDDWVAGASIPIYGLPAP